MSDATEDLAAAEEIEHAESDYERQRLINIQRNNAILQVLPPVRHAQARWRHVRGPGPQLLNAETPRTLRTSDCLPLTPPQ